MDGIFLIMISFPHLCKEEHRHKCGHQLSHNNGDPDAINAKDQRQQQDGCDLEYQGTQERNQCGDQSVVQCGKEGRAEDGHSREEEREGENAETAQRHIQQSGIVAHKQAGQGSGTFDIRYVRAELFFPQNGGVSEREWLSKQAGRSI